MNQISAHLVDVHGQLKPKLRGMVHAWSAIPMAIAGITLALLAPTPTAKAAVFVYALAVTSMLTASACYHRLKVSERVRHYLRRLDHSMIGVAVAGTYTPVVVLTMSGTARTTLLICLWAGALGAMAVSFLWPKAPSWVRAAVYLVLGWSGAVAMPSLLNHAGVPAFVMVLVGAGLYSLGALAYASRRPKLWPKVFGFHEAFHSLVVAAAISHMVAVGLVVAATNGI